MIELFSIGKQIKTLWIKILSKKIVRNTKNKEDVQKQTILISNGVILQVKFQTILTI